MRGVKKIHDMQIADRLDDVEAAMLQCPQIECPVAHHFGPGIYIREVFFPAGIYVMGHNHKTEHTCVMVKGRMAVIVGDEAKTIAAPMIFTGQPGRKFAYIIEDTVFQNIFATDETDVERLEDMFIEKSDAWRAAEIEAKRRAQIDRVVRGGK